jgi:hypothetical protein
VAIGVSNPNPVVETLDRPHRIAHRFERSFGVFDGKSEVGVDAAAGVGESQMGFPQFEGEPLPCESCSAAFISLINDVHPEGGVEPLGAREVLDFEDDLEHAQHARPRFVLLAEFDTVAIHIVEIQRARAAEGVFVEVEILREAVVPVVVFARGNRERVVGVQSAAGHTRRSAEHEVGFTSRKNGLVVVFAHGVEGEMLAVERARAVEIRDFEGEPAERRNHVSWMVPGYKYTVGQRYFISRRHENRNGGRISLCDNSWISVRQCIRHRRAHAPPSRQVGMPMKGTGRAEYEEIDRFDGGVGWLAYPDERMQRASHALATDEGVWLVDPVDAEGLDDLIAEFGEVAGVVVLLDRHTRDAARLAARHDSSVFIPSWMDGIEGDIDAPVERFDGQLGETGYRLRLVATPLWQEAALYHEDGTLVVSEALGTASYMRTDTERLGVHPALRLLPPRQSFSEFTPERVLVGHGAGVHEHANAALGAALSGSRRRAPALYLKTARLLLAG